MSDENLDVDLDKVRLAVKTGVPLVITTYTLPHNMEIYMNNVTTAFLNELRQNQMVQYIIYCQSELITNAKKANTKRVYFREKGLDVNDVKDYTEGMRTFKQDTLTDINHYLTEQKKAGLYVKLILQYRRNVIRIEVHNNSQLTYFEYKRIHDKICRAQQYTSIEESMAKILDDSEGAGLGLIIMILMLRKLGMSEENFQTVCENGITKTRIFLPLSQNTQKEDETVSRELGRIIDSLPQFPEEISKLNRLLNDPDSKISDIAMNISRDVTLTGELLKLVNSSAMGLSQKCGNIADAVKYIGLKGIKNMLFTIGSVKVLSSFPGRSELLWRNAYQVAFYAFNFAQNYFSNKNGFAEDAYLCGLLHDMGKIIYEGLHPDFLKKLQELCAGKGIDPKTFETILAGVDHAELGAIVAEKWNFPNTIIQVIRYHHCPADAPEEFKDLASVIYLSDMLVSFQEEQIDFYQIDEQILNKYKITNKVQFEKLSEKLYSAFQSQ